MVGRLLMSVAAVLVIAAGVALAVATARILGRRWLARLTGERTTARVAGKRAETDDEGAVSWTVRVAGVDAAGNAFAEDLPHGWREPPDVGTTVPVRYGRWTGVTLVRRTVGGFVRAVLIDAFIAAAVVIGLFMAGAVGYGLVTAWTTSP